MDLQLQGKVAVVTGGNRGIGKAVARQLAVEGMDVVIAARGVESLQATERELCQETGRRVVAIPVDTAQDASVRSMIEQAHARFGRIDVLVNAAARPNIGAAPRLAEIDDDRFYEDVNVKVMGYLRCAREAAPHMERQGWGRIVNISGNAARTSGSIIGSIRNVAVVALTKNLADELGPRGINVTVVHPGVTLTERQQEAMQQRARSEGISIEEAARRASNNSINRGVTPEEVADVVAFLASPRSVAINGDVIAAGGGVGQSIYY